MRSLLERFERGKSFGRVDQNKTVKQLALHAVTTCKRKQTPVVHRLYTKNDRTLVSPIRKGRIYSLLIMYTDSIY